ncbi:Fasciclin-2 [Gryllus bimaculatus]|nr:Fasciclin-2 [Gryllus bimaculatus]
MCRATPPAARAASALRLLTLLLCAAPCLVAPGMNFRGESQLFTIYLFLVAVAGNSSQKILIFSNISVDLSGNYTCRSKNAEYSPKPLSFAGAREQTAQQSGDATLQCAPRGNPAPEVSWLRNGAFVVNATAKLEVRKEGLLVRNVTRVDAGPYVCRAVQYLADDSVIKEHVINLTVQHEPEWHADYAKTGDLVYGYLGGLANLTCVAEAQPAGNITWLRGKSVVELGDNAAIFGDGRNSTLQLNLTAASAFGDYTCRANNALGARARVLTLKWGLRAPRPSAPQPQKAADARHALLRVDRPPTAPPPTPAAPADAATPAAAPAAGPTSLDLTGLRLLVRPSGAPHAPPRVVDLPFNEDYEYTLPDLQPGSWYEVRAQWRNAAGLSEESPPGEIHTSDLARARARPRPPRPRRAAAARRRHRRLLVMTGARHGRLDRSHARAGARPPPSPPRPLTSTRRRRRRAAATVAAAVETRRGEARRGPRKGFVLFFLSVRRISSTCAAVPPAGRSGRGVLPSFF